MVFEGLLIHKIPYKERDLIIKLLFRNGMMGSFYIYGGQGGGKKHKPTVFELGSMLKITVKNPSTKIESSELMICSEYQRPWYPEKIRHDVKAYYLMCLYLELIQKFAVHFHPGQSDPENQDQAGVFSVLSNALFYLEDALKKNQFVPHQQFFLFMIKLLHHLGIMPDTESCSYCQVGLHDFPSVIFLLDQGQFSCVNCAQGENEKGLLLRMKFAHQTKFQDYSVFQGTSFLECDKLLQYFCHHFQLRPVELKAYRLLFQ